MQSFTACVPLLTATSAFGLGRRCWSPQQCYLLCLRTLQHDQKLMKWKLLFCQLCVLRPQVWLELLDVLMVNTFCSLTHTHTHTHTRLMALLRDYPGEPVPKGKTNLDFTEARDSEWQWHQLGHMQVGTSLQTENHASTPPLRFFAGRLPFLQPDQQCQSSSEKLEQCL